MEASQPHRLVEVATRGAEIIEEAPGDIPVPGDRDEELICLRPWLMTERFGRRALGKTLAALSEGGRTRKAA